jgi:hypothetical protein
VGVVSRAKPKDWRADAVIDTVSGESQDQLFTLVKPGGVIVSAVARPDMQRAAPLRCCSFAAPSIPIESAREQEQEINRAEVPPLLFTLNYYLGH